VINTRIKKNKLIWHFLGFLLKLSTNCDILGITNETLICSWLNYAELLLSVATIMFYFFQ